MGESVCGLLHASEVGEGTGKIGWHCGAAHGLGPYAWPSSATAPLGIGIDVHPAARQGVTETSMGLASGELPVGLGA